MSRLIRQLLKEKDPLFSIGITRLEFAAGNPGIDTRLTAEILSTTKHKMSTLGLDPRDTTGAELYGALSQKARESNEHLQAFLGHPANVDATIIGIQKLISDIYGRKQTWRVKDVCLRTIIKNNPPKKVMKAFHFQSADSLAKRMSPAQVILAARLIESKAWWQRTYKLYENLSPKDFESAYIETIPLADEKWLPLVHRLKYDSGTSVISSKECGVVGYFPHTENYGQLVSLLKVLYSLNELSVYGAFLKLHMVNPSLGMVMTHALDDGELIRTSVSGTSFHWRDIYRHFGVRVAEEERTFAHLDIHDLGWLEVETKLSLLIPEFAFWVGLDFCGVSYGDGKIVSCNVLDVATSVHVGLGHAHMFTSALERSLRSELMARYLEIPVARALATKQFDISLINDENW